jgi:hypothetical protein
MSRSGNEYGVFTDKPDYSFLGMYGFMIWPDSVLITFE